MRIGALLVNGIEVSGDVAVRRHLLRYWGSVFEAEHIADQEAVHELLSKHMAHLDLSGVAPPTLALFSRCLRSPPSSAPGWDSLSMTMTVA